MLEEFFDLSLFEDDIENWIFFKFIGYFFFWSIEFMIELLTISKRAAEMTFE